MPPPPHQYVFHRATGQIVGPAVGIAPGDWPYGDLASSEVLWRYMEGWKFEDLLTHSALYFSRADKFSDPFEGRLAVANAKAMSPSDRAFNDAYRIVRSNEDATREEMRRSVFISCWHRATKESRDMWNAYTSGPDGVVMTTSAKALDEFVQGRIQKSTVKYHGDDYSRSEFGHTTLFFYKPAEYSFEREFRMLLTPDQNELVSADEVGRHVPIRLKKIIHRVITHPCASKDFKAHVDTLLQEYVKRIRREDSILLPCGSGSPCLAHRPRSSVNGASL